MTRHLSHDLILGAARHLGARPDASNRPGLLGGGSLAAGIVTAGLLAALLVTSACRSTQRIAGPLNSLSEDQTSSGPGALGQTEATLIRHSDGVRIQLPGMPAGFALESTKPSSTIRAGTIVHSAGSGRAELLWDGSAASVILSGPGALRLGEKDLGQPLGQILYVDRARILLAEGDSIELAKGVLLLGSEDVITGPFSLLSRGLNSLELTNQALHPARLRIGQFEVEIGGGSIVQIPTTLAAGALASPSELTAAPMDRIQAGRLELAVRGDLRWSEDQGVVRLEAAGPCEVDFEGLRLRLAAGESAEIMPLGGPTKASGPASGPTSGTGSGGN